MALSARKRKVVDNYMAGKSRKDSMLLAGYSKSYAETKSTDVFNDPEVGAEIERRQKLAARRSDMSLDWIIERLKMIADANVGDALDVYSDGTAVLNINKLDPKLKYAINKFSTKRTKAGRGENAGEAVENTVQFSDKLRALELLVKHLGLSKEKQTVEHTGEVSLVERLRRGRTQAGIEAGQEMDDD